MGYNHIIYSSLISVEYTFLWQLSFICIENQNNRCDDINSFIVCRFIERRTKYSN